MIRTWNLCYRHPQMVCWCCRDLWWNQNPVTCSKCHAFVEMYDQGDLFPLSSEDEDVATNHELWRLLGAPQLFGSMGVRTMRNHAKYKCHEGMRSTTNGEGKWCVRDSRTGLDEGSGSLSKSVAFYPNSRVNWLAGCCRSGHDVARARRTRLGLTISWLTHRLCCTDSDMEMATDSNTTQRLRHFFKLYDLDAAMTWQ